MNRILSLLALFALMLSACSSSNSVTLYDLRCENLNNPLGIDVTVPHFSWKIEAHRNGLKQTAYQILVASDPSLLAVGKTDLWNSGKIQSPDSVMVLYGGKELQARSHAYWKVGVWDETNKEPVWSDTASFSVGLLTASDWNGTYIGFPTDAGNPESPLMRKTFKVSESAKEVFLHVNSLGYHEVYLNGEKVGSDVLSPAVSQFNKRSLAVTYDLTPHVKKGNNDLVIWLGRGWYHPGLPGVVYNGPLLKAQLEEFRDGKWDTVLVSDASWHCAESGYTGIGTWKPWEFGGENVDAGKLLDDFSTDSLNTVTWYPVAEVNVPDHTVTPMMTQPNRIQATVEPVSISRLNENTWLVNMGKALTGYAEIKFPPLKEKQEIILEYSDHLDANGNPFGQGQRDRYVASGKDNEVFRNKFNYHGFQYIKISGLESQPEPDDIKAYLIHTDYKGMSSFQCSDPEMNAIHDMIHYTLRCLSLGGYLVDCPQIERLGYGGDGNASTQAAQIMFDLSPLYANWMQAWGDCIREDGSMPHTAPNPYRAGGGPYWCGFIITASWKTYINYGDARLIEKYYPEMQQWLGYVEKHSVDGLLQKWPDVDYRWWYLGDWATPTGVDQTAQASVDLVNNCFVSECYATMEKIAKVLDKTSDAKRYTERKEQIRKRIQDSFFDSAKNSYATGSQIDLIYPMLENITPPALTSDVAKTLFNMTEQDKKGHLAVGLVGIPVLTEWATRSRSSEWVYGMLKKKDYPGYLYMLENGATATWEHWDGKRSWIHNCYNGIGSWFYEAVGGIRSDENFPGYQKFVVSPQIPSGITWAKTSKETPYGLLTVNWTLEKGTLEMDLIIPPGCTAVLDLPEGISEYEWDGKSHQKASVNEIGSGTHKVSYRIE